MHKLQTGIEQPLAVLPQPPILLQPRKAALDHPALGHHPKFVQFITFGYLHRYLFAQCLTYTQREGLFRVSVVAQHALHPS